VDQEHGYRALEHPYNVGESNEIDDPKCDRVQQTSIQLTAEIGPDNADEAQRKKILISSGALNLPGEQTLEVLLVVDLRYRFRLVAHA
jgi:hypothetical protein